MVSAREIQAVAELLQVSPEGLQKAITFKVTVSLRILHPDKAPILLGPQLPLLLPVTSESNWRGGASLQASTWAFPSLDSLLRSVLPVWLEWRVDMGTHGMLASSKPSPNLAASELPLRHPSVLPLPG